MLSSPRSAPRDLSCQQCFLWASGKFVEKSPWVGVNFFSGLRFLGFLYSNASLHLAYSNLLTILTVLFLPAFLVPGNFSSNI